MSELPTPRAPRYHSLDLWRGVACLTVLVYHATFFLPHAAHRMAGPEHAAERWGTWAGVVGQILGRGWAGVPLFFVISGYCIAASCDTSRRRERASWATLHFTMRRWRRIFPPYWALLLATLAVVGLIARLAPAATRDHDFPLQWPGSLRWSQWVGVWTLTESWRSHMLGAPQHYFVRHAWTLCYEEMFYALAAVLLWVAPRRLFVAFAVVSVGIAAVRARVPTATLDGTLADGYWWPFAAGLLVYYARNFGGRGARWAAFAVLLAGIAWTWREPWHVIQPNQDVVQSQAWGFAFAGLLLLVEQRDRAIAAHWLSRPLMRIGGACYSVYLVHWPVVLLIGYALNRAGLTTDAQTLFIVLPISATVALGLAWLFHVHVERRFMPPPRVQEVETVELRRAA